jgi:hypothetical protein
MNTQQIDEKLRRNETTNEYFIGVYAADQLPATKISQDVWLLVCNCCPIDLPGEHWIALFGNARQEIDVFDSFGFPPNAYDGVHQFLRVQQPALITYNTQQLQSFDSDACGHYCLYFARYRSQGVPMNVIVENIVDGMTRDNYIKCMVGNVLY